MKKIKVNLLAIIGMMVAVATVAFTAPKSNAPQWYEVIVDAQFPDNESLQVITGTTSAPSPSDDCQTDITGRICKVQLDLHSTSTVPANMEEARQAAADEDLSIEAEANKLP